MKLLANGMPVTPVQDLLGHGLLLAISKYLKLSGQDVKEFLRVKRMI
jgi:site-specific recombinase XerD